MQTKTHSLVQTIIFWLFTLAVSLLVIIPVGSLFAQEVPQTPGCTDPIAENYDLEANFDNGTCEYIIGCMNDAALNYDPFATKDEDPSLCEFTTPDPAVVGCMDVEATNYNPSATEDEDPSLCEFTTPAPDPILGCMDAEATNYNPEATEDDESCVFDTVEVGIVGTISGMKRNADGNVGMSGWGINLYSEDVLISTTTTNDAGSYSFADLAEGSYVVCEETQAGWLQTTPGSGFACTNGTFGYEVSIASGTTEFINIDFENLLNQETNLEEDEPESRGGGGGGEKIEMVDRDGDPDERNNDEEEQESGGDGGAGNGESEDGPVPAVLGEQVSAVPLGAPGTGTGGTSQNTMALFSIALLGMLLSVTVLKVTKGTSS